MYMDVWAYMHTQMAEKVGQAQVHDATNLEDQKAVVDSMRSSKIEVRFEDLGSLEGSHGPNELKCKKSKLENYEQAWNVHLSQRAQLMNLLLVCKLRVGSRNLRALAGLAGARAPKTFYILEKLNSWRPS